MAIIQPPVVGFPITQLYGVNPLPHQPAGHDGLDFGCPVNTPMYAASGGRVVFAGNGVNMPYAVTQRWGFLFGSQGWASGNIVLVEDSAGLGWYTAHMNNWAVSTGQYISAGQFIGASGNTGNSSGPHVHWSVMYLPCNYGDPMYSRRNPLAFLPAGWNFVLSYGGNVGSTGPGAVGNEDPFMAELMG